MDHIAIMKKSWGLLEKIVSGEKTIESRWRNNKAVPWGRIKAGDTLYFQNSGQPVSIKSKVVKIIQIAGLTTQKTEEILRKYAQSGLGVGHILPEVEKYAAGKKYCLLIFFDNVQQIEPFQIDKKWFGAMAAWITVDDISKVRK